MGALWPLTSSHGDPAYLHGDHDIGRSERSRLVLAHPAVSSFHARIRWAGGGWVLRDLGSRNGTFVNERPLEVQRWHALAEGDSITFGNPAESWELTDASPPRPVLVPVRDGRATGEPIDLSSLAALPSAGDPRATIFQRADGIYVLEDGAADALVLSCGDRVAIGTQSFVVHLPADIPATESADGSPILRSVRAVRLTINAAPDEETAEIHVEDGQRRDYVPPRVHNYALLQLARLRTPGAEADGWVACEVLCDDLRMSSEQLAIHVFRIRDEFKKLGFADAGEIVDRQRRGWIRIGLAADRLCIGRIS